jgi:hypothetical protein
MLKNSISLYVIIYDYYLPFSAYTLPCIYTYLFIIIEITKFYVIFEFVTMIYHTLNLFLLFIIFTTFLCLSSSYDTPPKYSSILGPNLDKLPTQDKAIELFQQWMKDHGRVYKDLEEMAKKFDIFLSNLKYIIETNAKRKLPHGFLLGLTNFSDWSSQEFQEKYLHDIDMSMNNDTINVNGVHDLSSCSGVPSSLDWSLKGAVTIVKDQHTCGKFVVLA